MTSIAVFLLFMGLPNQAPVFAPAEPDAVAKAVITDQFGNPPPMRKDRPVGQVIFSAKASTYAKDENGRALPRSVKWTVKPDEYDARKWVPPDTDGTVFSIGLEGEPVTLTVFLSVGAADGSVDHTTLMIQCGEGSLPPPVPPIPPTPPKPDPPKPDPEPDNLRASKLALIVIEDVTARSVSSAKLLNDFAYWESLRTAGHSFAFYDYRTTEPKGQRYTTEIGTSVKPCLLLRDAEKDTKLTVVPLPEKTADIAALVKKWSKP